jgi:PAS domain S-box-containing protein
MDFPYKRYFEALPGYLTVQDKDFFIVDANKKFIEDFGNYQGRYCFQVYKRRSDKCEKCPVEKSFRDGTNHSSEEQVQCLDGKDVSVIVYTTPIRDEKGDVTAVIEMSTDITDIKNLIDQIRRSQERYQLLFDVVPCYITIQDANLRIVEANKKFRKDFGEYLGCYCFEIYKHREEQCVICPVMQTFSDGKVHSSEEVVTSLSGKKVNTLVYTAPIHDEDGNVKYVMEMSSDITPIRELQSQLESMGILISSISHGIKGMLNGLDGGIYLVNSAMKTENKKRLGQGLEIVQRNVERIRSLVLNILYYAKERTPNYESISPTELIEDVSNLLKSKAEEQKIQLIQELSENTENFEVDSMAMHALLINILENSIDACQLDKKKQDHIIKIILYNYPDSVEIVVSDNGIGMSREVREKAFTLFFSSKGAKGTGLGLFIANNIAQSHDGSIEIESEPEKGTTFIIRIPKRAIKNQTTEPQSTMEKK